MIKGNKMQIRSGLIAGAVTLFGDGYKGIDDICPTSAVAMPEKHFGASPRGILHLIESYFFKKLFRALKVAFRYRIQLERFKRLGFILPL